MQAIWEFDIPSKVPLDGSISFEDLAKKIPLKQSDLQRILRFAMVYNHIFQEKTPGVVSHTAASRLLVESVDARAGLGFMFDECYQSFAHTVEAVKSRGVDEPNDSVSLIIDTCTVLSLISAIFQGWAVSQKANVPLWEYHTTHPELGERASRAMVAFTKGFNLDTRALTTGYDWSTIGSLIDLGGANGHVAVDLARANPKLRCIVQELPEIVEKAKDDIPDDVADRVSLVPHSFFDPQPTSADAYLFRQIFHNWSDVYGLKMLKALVPAMRKGAKVIINDNIVPPPGVLQPMQEKAVRSMDMIMMSLFNSREREKGDWERLFAEADERFGNVTVWTPEGSQLGLVEATWSG